MNNSRCFCWIRYSGMSVLPGLVRLQIVSDNAQKLLLSKCHTLVTQEWAGGTGKKSVMDSLTHTIGLR